MSNFPVRVTVWGENVHEHEMPDVREHYPHGMHETIAEALRRHLGDRAEVRTATLQEPEHGLTEEVLAATDVLTWWGHAAHGQVSGEVVVRVHRNVLAGMGLLVLHSGHESKIFKSLMGTSCSLHWRDAGEREIVWTVNPAHPITQDVPETFIVPQQEMYGEYFDIPQPDELIFISSFSGGEVFRSGCCFRRGAGRIFYFSPGHEAYPIYHQSEIQRVLANGVMWAYRGSERRPPTEKGAMPEGWFERG
jgi:trehalose utilization protein